MAREMRQPGTAQGVDDGVDCSPAVPASGRPGTAHRARRPPRTRRAGPARPPAPRARREARPDGTPGARWPARARPTPARRTGGPTAVARSAKRGRRPAARPAPGAAVRATATAAGPPRARHRPRARPQLPVSRCRSPGRSANSTNAPSSVDLGGGPEPDQPGPGPTDDDGDQLVVEHRVLHQRAARQRLPELGHARRLRERRARTVRAPAGLTDPPFEGSLVPHQLDRLVAGGAVRGQLLVHGTQLDEQRVVARHQHVVAREVRHRPGTFHRHQDLSRGAVPEQLAQGQSPSSTPWPEASARSSAEGRAARCSARSTRPARACASSSRRRPARTTETTRPRDAP